MGRIAAASTAVWRVEILDHTALYESWVGNGIRHSHLGEAWAAGADLLSRWNGPTDFRIMREGLDVPYAVWSCNTCRTYANQMHPSHAGSSQCESGSLASGGNRTHCTCDACF